MAELGHRVAGGSAAGRGVRAGRADRQPRLHLRARSPAACPARSARRSRRPTAKDAARSCALNALAAVDALVGLDSVVRVVKVVGFVASAPGFTGQPGVINGASELLGEVFGDAGAHARSAVGVAELPLGVPVEVELIVEVR